MSASPGVTVTGNLQDLSGTGNPGSLQWTLVNFGTTPPVVSGTMVLAPVVYTTQAASNGSFSQVLWGNYQLLPGNTYYQLNIYSATGALVASAPYFFASGGSFDLSTLTPLTAVGGSTFVLGVTPVSISKVSHEWLDSYAANTGVFTQSQPGFSDLSGSIALSQTALSTLGDLLYVNGTPALARLAGNTSSTLAVLTQTGTGTVSAAPVWTSSTGTGNVVLATSPTLVTPVLGAASATTVNGLTITSSTGTLTIANGKTATVNNSLTFAGTDATVMTFPSSSATIAGLGIAQTWSANQTFSNGKLLLAGSSSGTTTLEASATASGVITFPAVTDTVACIGTAQTWTGVQTFNNGKLLLAGSSSGTTTLEASATASGTITLPAVTGTVAVLSNAQTWSAAQTFNNGDLLLSGSSSGTTTLEASATASGVITFPATTDTVVTLAASQTLTNKTLTSPVINNTPSGTGIPTTTVKTGTGAGNYSSTSTTLVNVDGTNLSYTVTIPVGWKLLIWVTCEAVGASSSAFFEISLADGGTALAGAVFPEQTTNVPITLPWAITGDGNSHTVTLQYKTSNSSDSVTIANNSSTATPVMVFFLTPSN